MNSIPFSQYQLEMVLDCRERLRQFTARKTKVPLEPWMSSGPFDQDLRLTLRRDDVHVRRWVIA
jgi:hypothetical protein